MALIQEISDQIKQAMKSGDAQRRDALRLILNALKTEEKENENGEKASPVEPIVIKKASIIE